MSIVGPRPEDWEIVHQYYTPEQRRTLEVRPGLVSPANVRWYLYHRPDSLGAGYVRNFSTTYSTKPGLMTNVKSCFEFGEIPVRSHKLLDEMFLVQREEDGYIGAPQSADSDEKDDRVMAMAFAALAYSEWRQRELIAEGMTYERVTKMEREEIAPVTKQINTIVYNYLARQEQRANEPPPRGTQWQVDNGLV